MADLIFVQTASFGERLGKFNPRVHQFRFGVNLEQFNPLRVARGTSAISKLPRPIIGYSGGLHWEVDFGLLVETARSFPEGSLVLVGPVVTEPGPALRARPNVHLLGARAFAELPALVSDFDVALVPYARTAYTETVFPTKLLEYLAAGRPAVSTNLPEVRKLGLPEWAVRIADGSAGFTGAVREALRQDTATDVARRAQLARAHDWREIVERMAALIAERAAAKQ